jgi:trehalose/maltose hydrolase-like predicted phosphorylase
MRTREASTLRPLPHRVKHFGGVHDTLPALDRRFEALVFDWDGTAVPDRRSDASRLRDLIERLCRWGMHVAIVSGTHVGNVDGQLAARPTGPGTLLLALNRGSEIFAVDASGPRLLERRTATRAEERALDDAAARTIRVLRDHGLRTELVSRRLNRRKIDLIPEDQWRDPPKADIARLVTEVTARLRAAGFEDLRDVVAIAREAAKDAGLTSARVTSDAKHVEIGLTDKSDSAHWIFRFLAREGVGAKQVLVGGDEFGPLGGVPGSDSLMLVPDAARATVVSVGPEPAGVPPPVLALGGGPTCVVEGDHERERAAQALVTLSDGLVGTRGRTLAATPTAPGAVFASGVYRGSGEDTTLLPCPVWHEVFAEPDAAQRVVRRLLDLRTFLLQESLAGDEPMRALRFSSVARPGSVVLRAEYTPRSTPRCPSLSPPADADLVIEQAGGERPWMTVRSPSGGGVAAAIGERVGAARDRQVIERIGAYVASPVGAADLASARAAVSELEQAGFDLLLHEHRRAWAQRWEDALVTIDGAPHLEFAARFALGHILAAVPDRGEAAVGARGLSGSAYRGHVFWDADVFVLPVLAATNPAAARAMLEYRVRRLPAAREAARAEGRSGARFPWESAQTGRDVTPRYARDRRGRVIPIRTGALEVHIVGCVAWAAAHYVDWTGDEEFANGPGAELITETARYWASRARYTGDGRAHIYGVIGPDEYHEPVDDNAFTNVLARWNLRLAASLDSDLPTTSERDDWRRLADALVDGYDPLTGRYEQFAGFDALEPLVIAQVAPRRPIAADLLLGPERVRGAQVVKQADVLMLHHLLPGEVAPGSLDPNLEYYEPRTAHGSSLSPGIHAALLARAGRLDEALGLLDVTARIDLDDITDTTAGGLHLGAMGSMWQALAFGFLGARASGHGLQLDPRIPDSWSHLEMRLRYRGRRVTVRAETHRISIVADAPLPVILDGRGHVASTDPLTLERRTPREPWRRAEPPTQEPR